MKKIFYLLIFLFIVTSSLFVLMKNIKRPDYYAAGYISVHPDISKLASSYHNVFFALYTSANNKMPYGASRQTIHHDFTRGSYHFILNKENFFIMRKGEDFPKTFNLKVTLSKSDKVSLVSSGEKISDTQKGLKLGETQIRFNLLPKLQSAKN